MTFLVNFCPVNRSTLNTHVELFPALFPPRVREPAGELVKSDVGGAPVGHLGTLHARSHARTHARTQKEEETKMYDANVVMYLVQNNYVHLDVERIMFDACEKQDAECLRLLHVSNALTTGQRLAVANKAREVDFPEGIEIVMSNATPVEAAEPARKRRSGGQRRTASVNLKNTTVAEYKDAILYGRARAQYRLPLLDAIEGKGIKMNYGVAHHFGTNDCLEDAPLVVEDPASVQLWLQEVLKLDAQKTAGQGALRAMLNHFHKAHKQQPSPAVSTVESDTGTGTLDEQCFEDLSDIEDLPDRTDA